MLKPWFFGNKRDFDTAPECKNCEEDIDCCYCSVVKKAPGLLRHEAWPGGPIYIIPLAKLPLGNLVMLVPLV